MNITRTPKIRNIEPKLDIPEIDEAMPGEKFRHPAIRVQSSNPCIRQTGFNPFSRVDFFSQHS